MLTMYNLDNLINSNGNWRLVYVYNNYGNNTLMLVPNFQVDELEELKVANLINMGEGEFEDSYIIDQFIRDCSDTPFIIRGESFIASLHTIQDRLSNCITGTDFVDYSLFNKEFEQFTKFLDVCYLSYQDGNSYNKYDVYYKGWKNFIQ